MALALNIHVEEPRTCDEFVFNEVTGAYDATTNDTGWDQAAAVGSIPATSDAIAATLTITLPGETTPLAAIDLFAQNFPTVNSDLDYIITPAALGYTDGKHADGIYRFTYVVTETSTGSELDYTKDCYILASCQAECCIDQMYAAVDGFCTTCDKTKLYKAIEAEGYLAAAKAALACNKVNMAQVLFEKVQFMCNSTNCRCN